MLYYRVSTVQQGKSGLGLDAQQAAIYRYIEHRPYSILEEFTEVQSSNRKKNKERPKLKEALRLCREQSATLIVYKLDRLERNVKATAELLESGIDFICVDNPDINKFTLQILACVAEKELEDISTRTKNALAEKKRQGFKLGKPENFTLEHKRLGAQAVNRQKALQADSYAVKLFPTLSFLVNSRNLNPHKAAQELNRMNIPSPKGRVGNWCATQVQRCLKRVENVVVNGQQFSQT